MREKITARVVSATELNYNQLSSLQKALSNKFGKDVTVLLDEDPSLIGGLLIEIEGRIIDNTVKRKLEEIKQLAKSKSVGTRQASIVPEKISDKIKKPIGDYKARLSVTEYGHVLQVGDGIVHVDGLQGAMSGELLEFENGIHAIALNLDRKSIGAVLMGSDSQVKEGSRVRATGKVAEVPVGDALLGRVVNALGQPIDQKGEINHNAARRIERIAPGVTTRREIDTPLQTGVKAIDVLVPIGRGQRELIIGDRQTGKTALCIDTIINQKGKDVICIYVAIGQKASTVARIQRTLEEYGAMKYTTIVAATASDSASLQYIAPYAGCAMGEEWMEQGKDVLIVYDDLSKHAVAYRALSLLLRRPPGREAYPGDVFYLHSRLLERAACLAPAHGGGSLTALPIIETLEGDISAYISTNVISITDGQIYLETELFNDGIRPAVNPGFSVSRVGGAAQIKAMKKIAGPLRIELAQYRELQSFVQFGSDLSEDTMVRLEHGKRIVEILKQNQYSPMPVEQQVLILYVLTNNHLSDVPVEKVQRFQRHFLKFINENYSDIPAEIADTKEISDELEERILEAIEEFKG
ncbi:MAG: F0F1 ATP synthase subunit alpha [Oscillospiraceae bacterium]|nr:F0F1 ATP synthase subunit alpha [Oscillospiraceae bacterium]